FEPASLQGLLARAAVRCGSDELAFLAEALGAAAQEAGVAGDASAASAANAANAASAASTVTEDPRRRAAGLRRARTVRVVRARLAALLAPGAAEAAAADAEVSALNADPAALHALLELQHYRLASWRMAGSRALGFRRFFDINTLVGLRVEDAAVFDDAHRLVLDLLAAGTIDGVRVDHVDGLRDPRGYLERLRAAAPRAWILVEKILAPDEALRPEWPVDGSTGYDFLALVGGLFVDPAGAEPLRRLHAEFTGNGASWDEQRTASRRLALESLLRADVLRLVELLADACERDLLHRDHPRRLLQEALVEVLSRFPVYRTYVSAGRGEVSEADRALLRDVVARSAQARADLPPDLFDFLLDILTLSRDDALHADIALHVQQLAAPAAAKGVEDTAFYRHAPLLALNEVGGDPDRFGVEPGEFLRRCAESQQRWPATLLATSTHDTKFSEDVRARLAVLSELPEAWRDAVQRWSGLAQRHRTGVLPDRAMEWRLWQSWVGAHPIDVERMQAAMLKAAREAKLHTSWTAAQPGYEAALQRFVQGVMEDEEIAGDVAAFTATILDAGRRNALSQTLLKLTAPGVPDIYQGCELWSLRLVDPDNHAPVEWAGLRRALDELRDATPERILERMDGGLPKLHVIRATLALRAAHPEAFGPESPVGALPVAGARAAHVVAMARGDRLAVLAPRLVVRLGGDWRDTTVVLGAGTWRNVFTAERVSGG
ncbi:MAG TPA: malto-oligosyltrehalose synthase, partial [Planctomycetota bacterium]|nr:malto-oligosyltrehalose synthase [Planctomycetota bacterium]